MTGTRCECCGGIDSTCVPHTDGLCQRCHYYRRRLQLGTRIETVLAALIRRHPHDAARIRRLRHWMMRNDAADATSVRAANQ